MNCCVALNYPVGDFNNAKSIANPDAACFYRLLRLQGLISPTILLLFVKGSGVNGAGIECFKPIWALFFANPTKLAEPKKINLVILIIQLYFVVQSAFEQPL